MLAPPKPDIFLSKGHVVRTTRDFVQGSLRIFQLMMDSLETQSLCLKKIEKVFVFLLRFCIYIFFLFFTGVFSYLKLPAVQLGHYSVSIQLKCYQLFIIQ